MLSIVTVTYNNYGELINTLNSIPEISIIESIVINGGQCEKTKEFLKTHKGKSISEKDEGIADAFNKGVKLSSGNYLMFLNSGDVLISQDYLKNAVKYFENDVRISFIHSNIVFSDKSGAELFMKPQMKNVGRGMPYNHPTMILRKKVFDEIGLFKPELKYAMDLDLVVRMEKKNYSGFYLNNEAVVKMDGAGVSVNKEFESIKECYKVLKSEKYFNFTNVIGYSTRCILYVFRKLLELSGGKKILMKLKQIKHKA